MFYIYYFLLQPVYRIERTELNPVTEEISENMETTDLTDVECINVVDEYRKNADENKSHFQRYKYKFVDSNRVRTLLLRYTPVK